MFLWVALSEELEMYDLTTHLISITYSVVSIYNLFINLKIYSVGINDMDSTSRLKPTCAAS